MDINKKILAFSQLGVRLNSLEEEELEDLLYKVSGTNSWFTKENVNASLNGLAHLLRPEPLKTWGEKYDIKNQNKRIGIVMAGNIPAVGFHDFLCVLMSGNVAVIKLSSQDEVLMTFIFSELLKIEPLFEPFIRVQDQLKNIDAVIATGSDNTSRYFNYYFSKYPHIIRKNRTSCAVLNGNENIDDFLNLGLDIFQYYGLGCRNVSKLYVPENHNFNTFFEGIESFNSILNHHKYNNNYDYNKSIYLVNKEPHLDNGFLLLKQSDQLVSPISVLFYEEYSSEDHLNTMLQGEQDKIQCIVSSDIWWPKSLAFGNAQSPGVDDYADNIDTMQFLIEL